MDGRTERRRDGGMEEGDVGGMVERRDGGREGGDCDERKRKVEGEKIAKRGKTEKYRGIERERERKHKRKGQAAKRRADRKRRK